MLWSNNNGLVVLFTKCNYIIQPVLASFENFLCFVLFFAFQKLLISESHVFIKYFLLRCRKGDIGNGEPEETRTYAMSKTEFFINSL